MGFRSSVSLLPAIQAARLWLLPRRDCLPLNASAFAGRTGITFNCIEQLACLEERRPPLQAISARSRLLSVLLGDRARAKQIGEVVRARSYGITQVRLSHVENILHAA